MVNNIQPLGWEHQIQNDVVLNFKVFHQQELISYKSLFMLCTEANLHLGTLSDKAGLGFTMMFGYFDSPFKSIENKSAKKF